MGICFVGGYVQRFANADVGRCRPMSSSLARLGTDFEIALPYMRISGLARPTGWHALTFMKTVMMINSKVLSEQY